MLTFLKLSKLYHVLCPATSTGRVGSPIPPHCPCPTSPPNRSRRYTPHQSPDEYPSFHWLPRTEQCAPMMEEGATG